MWTGGDSEELLAESSEGDIHSPWPPSPALQELHVQRPDASREVALLVGRAGTSHWSSSIEVEAHRLRFDVACRVQEAAKSLGSSYRLLTRAQHRPNEQIVWPAHGLILRCSGEPTTATKFAQVGDEELRLAPAALPSRLPSTVRWAYEFVVETRTAG